MPRYNGTGPFGYGPGTGWGLGPCGGGMAYGRQSASRIRGTGWGRGYGPGFGWKRFWGYNPIYNPSKKEEAEMLSGEAKILEQELKAIKSRLVQLEDQK